MHTWYVSLLRGWQLKDSLWQGWAVGAILGWWAGVLINVVEEDIKRKRGLVGSGYKLFVSLSLCPLITFASSG